MDCMNPYIGGTRVSKSMLLSIFHVFLKSLFLLDFIILAKTKVQYIYDITPIESPACMKYSF
jgi:hypothetical protein